MAKAVRAENVELRDLDKYRDAHSLVAVQMPKQRARSEWDKAVRWLHSASEDVVTFEDKQSLDMKLPHLLQESESPRLLQRA